jgi:nuclear pore complex protein Nup188
MLIQRLAGSTLVTKDTNQLLGTLFSAINSIDEPFGAESITCYRTLLKALYVTLRAYSASERAPGETKGTEGAVVTLTQTILNIVDRVVARGFRALVALIHDPEASVAPEDLVLLTAILQACLSMPGMDQSQSLILNIVATHDAVHVASSLFSWADKVTDNGDPIYGELSLLFLLELSTMPVIAEQLACDGILSHITSANLTNFMRRANISPFSDAIGSQRCYSIWAKGLLPLLLNLLTALGATVAPEIAYVLNQFPHLLASSVKRLEAPGASRTASKDGVEHLTLIAASEANSLALITRVLQMHRARNNRDIPEVQWDGAALLENVDFWLSTRKLLKDRLLPLGQRELEWRNNKTKTTGPDGQTENLLEAKVVSQLEAIRDILSDNSE